MATETRKQIAENLRHKISKQYKDMYQNEIESLQRSNARFNELYNKVSKENAVLKQENETLKEKVQEYEDWINRLQDFCNLPEDERLNAIQKFRVDCERSQRMNGLMETYSKVFGMLFH